MQSSTLALDALPAGDPSSRWVTLTRLLNSAPVAYLMIALLQLGAVWGMWNGKDVTNGDTSSYSLLAYRWAEQFQVNIVWSPLYTAYFGSFLFLTDDIAQAVLLHRLVIVFAATLLVLAVMRHLLPPGWAFLMASWWAILPINFNTLYEVHLFALLPLLAVWLVFSCPGRQARAAALALLAAAVVVMRNEMSVAVGLLGLGFLAYEWYVVRNTSQPRGRLTGRILATYGGCLLIAAGFCMIVYSRSHIKPPYLSSCLRDKHTLNMAQTYAVGYQQRNPAYTRDPWTDHHELLTDHFGKADPSLREMIATNPRAVALHVAWNLRLTPAGIQVLLFNGTSGRTNPDYVEPRYEQHWVKWASFLLLGCWVAGLAALVYNWRFWWRAWLKQRGLVWAGVFAVVAVTPVVICTQRPRPSYLFALSVFLMVCTGMSLFILSRGLRRFGTRRAAPLLVPILMAILVGTVWLLPGVFAHYRQTPSDRPLYTRLERAKPFESLYRARETTVIQGENAYEIHNYIGSGNCVAYGYDKLKDGWKKGVPLEQYLAEQEINALFVDETLLDWLQHERPTEARAFLGKQLPPGWTTLGSGDVPGDRWWLYHWPDAPLPSRLKPKAQ